MSGPHPPGDAVEGLKIMTLAKIPWDNRRNGFSSNGTIQRSGIGVRRLPRVAIARDVESTIWNPSLHLHLDQKQPVSLCKADLQRLRQDLAENARITRMATEHIVALLIAERDKLNRAIDALGAPVKRRGRPPASAAVVAPVATVESAPKKRKVSAAARKKMAAAQKKRWAAIKAAAEA